MQAPVQLSFETSSIGDIGRITFDNPAEKVNTLSSHTLDVFENLIDSLTKRTDLKALLITSKIPSQFIAGADIKEFPEALKNKTLLEKLLRKGHRCFNKLENLPFPTIAVIDGPCYGGGLELALACTYRTASDNPKTSFGLLETTLGVIPGWGGSQRLPRLVGLATGLDMILSGKKIDTKQAWKLHLIDRMLHASFLESGLESFLQTISNANGRKEIFSRRSKKSLQQLLLETNPIGKKILFHQANSALQAKTKGHYLAPATALKLIEESYSLPLPQGLEKEVETILDNVDIGLSQATGLVDLFFTQEALKKETVAYINANSHTPIHSTAVIGAGTMGSTIAWLFANENYEVKLKDLNWQILGRASGQIHALFAKGVQYRKLTKDQMNLKFHHLSCTTDYTGFKTVDFVLEAIPENLAQKQQQLKDIENAVSTDTVIGTNTSSLTVAELSQGLSHPERFIGMHFFNPVNKMPLVEIIPGEKSTPGTIAKALEFCKKIGKTPLIVGDCPGFLVNRILACGLNEATWMLQDGIPMHAIEKAFTDFGMPMSPFLLSDELGNDVCYKASKTLEKGYGERLACPKLIEQMYQAGLYGKKCGKGFYLYSSQSQKSNPAVTEMIKALKVNKSTAEAIDSATLQDRFILCMINEATRCLEENIVPSPNYLDLALILGAGFPAFRGGLMKYADSLGKETILNKLKGFESIYGARFTPSTYFLKK
jgi:3-hydroxyacyl-CoA dehydrogenase / enoyl-CoA hydratase / 3-hydroxybutyryl-CoA epimerase